MKIPNILEGSVRDRHGNELSNRSGDTWSTFTYDKHGRILKTRHSYGGWSEYTRNKTGDPLTFINHLGVCRQWCRVGNLVGFIDTNGYWRESIFGQDGLLLAVLETGKLIIRIARSDPYTLWYHPRTDRYTAGCHAFSPEGALHHWGYRLDKRAKTFTHAIREHRRLSTAERAELHSIS